MIGDIQGFRLDQLDESKLLARLGESLENLRALSKDSSIKAAVEHMELSILNALETDLRRGEGAANALERKARDAADAAN
jgi:hypothetical protein